MIFLFQKLGFTTLVDEEYAELSFLMSFKRIIGSCICARSPKCRLWWVFYTSVLIGSIQAQDRPNVLILYSDAGLQNPDVDLLAADGIEWDHFLGYGNPALDMAAILTGKYPLRLGVRGQWHREGVISQEEVLLPELFGAQGYATAYFGPWYHGGQFPQTPKGQGFGTYFGHSLQSSHTLPDACPSFSFPAENPVLVDHLLDWLTVPRQQPFFAVAALEEREAWQITRTPGGTATVDSPEKREYFPGTIRQIFGHLDSLGHWEQTIVVLIGMPTNNPTPLGYPVQGRSIILWRGFLPSARLPYPAVPMDVFPTLAGLCQISVPEDRYIDGIHLNAILQGAPDHSNGRPLFFPYADRGLQPFPGMVVWKSRCLDLRNGTQSTDIVPEFLPPGNIWPEGEETAYWLRSAYLEWYKGMKIPSGTLPVPVGCGTDTICISPEACLQESMGFPQDPQQEPSTAVTDTLIWQLQVCRSGTLNVEIEGWLPNKKNRLTVEFSSDIAPKATRMEWGGDDTQDGVFRAKIGTVFLQHGTGYLRVWSSVPQQGNFHLTSVRLSVPVNKE